ncbi:phosphate propanoyltransferase [Desulfosporosinus sp.]|uniref:phosphate propanoyltransferase n=1 Tax=Desulfosporosinus sp. TaxID=157907 RepID=UPI0025C10151|nr:phosphate propanoyltransferase [Desulfosporosinus sp.]MBC2722542.1 phosphate propanoyltransferase [Desulfosporosinus sp.]MBC2728155.1 phosphate propanoyltransferase [Desulfosporosinus sp.]
MDQNQLLALITEAVAKHLCHNFGVSKIPVAISNRHVHLSQEDMDRLFGANHRFKVLKNLSQPGQFAYEEQVTLVGPKGVIEKVRILGPARPKTQVEISISDGIKLGVKAPIRDSGELAKSASLTLVGPLGSTTLPEGTIIAARHIHMHPEDAARFGVKDKDRINVKAPGNRSLVFNEMLIRVSDQYKLEMHIDIDEANAAYLKNNDFVEIV